MSFPIILNESLQATKFKELLANISSKVRFSKTTERNSVIFPTASLAFLVLPIYDFMKKNKQLDEELIAYTLRFLQVNRGGYLLLVWHVLGQSEIEIYGKIQNSLQLTGTVVLLARNLQECTEIFKKMVECNTKLCQGFHETIKSITDTNSLSFEDINKMLYLKNKLMK